MAIAGSTETIADEERSIGLQKVSQWELGAIDDGTAFMIEREK